MKPKAWVPALMLLASNSLAATPSPATIDNPGIEAWLRTHIDSKGWTIIAADQLAVALGSPNGVAVLKDGTIMTDVRREYYAANATSGEPPMRSIIMRWIVDCSGKRYRAIEVSTFGDSNLKELIASWKDEAGPWFEIKPNSQNERVRARICDAPKTGQRLSPASP